MSTIVRLGPEYFPDPTKGNPIYSGSIYIGEPDLDPEIVANQIQVSAVQENGSSVAISQPIDTGPGGVPLYNGSPVTLTVELSYSIKVLDSSGSQVYYVANTDADYSSNSNVVFLSDYGGDMAAAVVAIGSDVATLRVDVEPIDLTANLEISSTNITLDWASGCVLDGAFTLTFNNSALIAGNYQVFGADLTVAGLSETIPDWWKFNAVPGTTDMGTAINSAFAATRVSGVARFLECEGYASSIPLTCLEYINIEMMANAIYTGSSDITFLTVGTGNIVNQLVSLRIKLLRSVQSDWASDDNIGVKLFNTNTCRVHLDYIANFTINAQLIASGAGNGYNTIYVGMLINGKYNLDLYAGTIGWVNENLFIGGRFATFGSVNTTLNRYGVRITSQADASGGDYFPNDNNVFIKPCFEMGKDVTTGDAVGILMEYGQANQFLGCRDEGNDFLAVVRYVSANNLIETAFGGIVPNDRIADTSTYRTTITESLRGLVTSPSQGTFIYGTGALHKTACYGNGSTSVSLPGVAIANIANSLIYSHLTSISIASSYIELAQTRGLTMFMDTRNKKRFIFRQDSELFYGGKIGVKAFDSAGTQLTDAGPAHPYVTGQSQSQMVYTPASFGGVYRTGADSNGELFFSVGDDVASIQFVYYGEAAVLRTRGFSLFSLDGGFPVTWTGYEETIPGVNLGSTPPTVGTWSIGREILIDIPVIGSPKGWICTVSGTPDTWVSLGNL